MTTNATYQTQAPATLPEGFVAKVRNDGGEAVQVVDVATLPAVMTDGTQRTKITDGAGVVNTRTVGSAVVAGDVGLISHSMIHGLTTGGGGGYVDVKVTPSGALTVEVNDGGGSLTVDGSVSVSNFPSTYPVTDNGGSLTVDATSLPLPTGAATEATLGAINTKTPSLGAAAIASSTPVNIASNQVVPVSLPASMSSAFGTLETGELTPVFQDDFTAGLNTQKWQSSYTFTITAPATYPVAGDIYTVNNQTYTVTSAAGTTLIAIGGGAPPASGTITRVTGAGTTPITFSAFTTQVGVQTGTGASVDTNAGRLRIQSGTSATGYAYIASRRIIKYRPGQGTTIRCTPIMDAGVASNLQLVGVGTIIANAIGDGYFVGTRALDGAFGIHHYIGGSPTFTAQSAFNGDTLDGNGASGININQTFGTPWQIKYPFLGYGDILFQVQNPTTGAWITAHTIRYANTSNAIQLSNPNLQFIAYSLNSGNTTNKTIYVGSTGCFISGQRSYVANVKGAIDATKTGITTEAAVITLRNASSYNGVTGRGLIRLQSISVSETTVTASNVTIRFKIGAALGGSPSFTAVNGTTSTGGIVLTAANSVASYDTAGTTVTGGTYIYNVQIGSGNNGGSSAVVDLAPYEIFIAPGETLTVSATSPNNASIGVSLNWTED